MRTRALLAAAALTVTLTGCSSDPAPTTLEPEPTPTLALIHDPCLRPAEKPNRDAGPVNMLARMVGCRNSGSTLTSGPLIVDYGRVDDGHDTTIVTFANPADRERWAQWARSPNMVAGETLGVDWIVTGNDTIAVQSLAAAIRREGVTVTL